MVEVLKVQCKDAEVGLVYKSEKGKEVKVVKKTDSMVTLELLGSGNQANVPITYMLTVLEKQPESVVESEVEVKTEVPTAVVTPEQTAQTDGMMKSLAVVYTEKDCAPCNICRTMIGQLLEKKNLKQVEKCSKSLPKAEVVEVKAEPVKEVSSNPVGIEYAPKMKQLIKVYSEKDCAPCNICREKNQETLSLKEQKQITKCFSTLK